MVWIGVFLVLMLVGGAAWMVVIGMRENLGTDPLEERLAEYAERGEMTSLEEIELSQPFMERVVYPAAQRFGNLAQRITPQHAIMEAKTRLEMGRAPKWLAPSLFLTSRFVIGLFLGLLTLLLFSFSSTISVFSWRSLGIAALLALMGFFVPNLMLNSRIQKRQHSILLAMPDAIDLLTICVEAGLGFDAALKKIVEKWQNDLSLAFARVLQEIQVGKVRTEALRDMSDLMGLKEMDSFVAAVIQSEQMGVSMARVLRVQADSMRIKRRQNAEENAQQAPVKMLLPMAFLIFPTIVIMLLGPAILQMIRSAAVGSVF